MRASDHFNLSQFLFFNFVEIFRQNFLALFFLIADMGYQIDNFGGGMHLRVFHQRRQRVFFTLNLKMFFWKFMHTIHCPYASTTSYHHDGFIIYITYH